MLICFLKILFGAQYQPDTKKLIHLYSGSLEDFLLPGINSPPTTKEVVGQLRDKLDTLDRLIQERERVSYGPMGMGNPSCVYELVAPVFPLRLSGNLPIASRRLLMKSSNRSCLVSLISPA